MTVVAIAGAGLAGLTAALALARQKVRVELFDRAPVLSEAGAGVQLSPNATRRLAALGVLDRIKDSAVSPDAIRIRRGSDGADLAVMRLGTGAEARYGAPFIVAHRADVQAALLDAVRGEPLILFATGESLDRFEIDGDRARIWTRSAGGGRELTVDGLVGADGVRSTVRAGLGPAAAADGLRTSGRTAWRALVPAEAAPAHSRSRTSNLWLGPRSHLVHYPVRGGALVNVVAIVGDDGRGEMTPGMWSMPGDADVLRGWFRGWAPGARALIDAVRDWRVWPLVDRAGLGRWSHGPVTLIGDAAHPMLPFLAQGAAQAIEDGWALGQAARDAASFAEAAIIYERERRPLAHRVQRESRRQGAIYHLGGPAASLRNAAIGLLGPDRMLSRYDWLYGPKSEAGRP